jgi:hypothetical protein
MALQRWADERSTVGVMLALPKGLGLLGRSFGKFVCTSGGGLRAPRVSTPRDMTWDGLASKTLECQEAVTSWGKSEAPCSAT